MEYFDFAMIIKDKRLKMNLRQKDVCLKLNIKPSKYNLIENGKREPNFLELVNICNFFNINFTNETKEKEALFRPHID